MARQLRSVIGAFCKRCILTTALLACASPVLARTARVPGDFWTIQAAVDYLAQFYVGDTVLVAAGYYPERVVIPDAIRLEGIPAPGSAEPVPRIDELHIQPPRSGRYAIEVVGIHVAGPARTAGSDGPARVYFESCRFDEGMEGGNWYPDIEIISMRRCTLLGTVSLKAVETVVESCTVKAPLVLLAVGAVVTDNQFENIPGFAATISTEQDAHVARNTVRGGDAGFKVRTTEYYLAIEDNVIEGCKGPGIVSESAWYGSTIDRNHISRCGGTGISAYGVLRLNGNRVFDCGGHGLDLVQFEHAALVAGNVVGRCGGDGIRLQRDWDESSVFQVRGNTAYACAGSGIVGLATASISNNIAFRNGGSGLETGGTDVVTSSCNDWFENRAGSNSSGAPSTTDLSLDPIFCDLAADDVHLRSDSPLLNAPGCGLIGALGQGCEAPVVAMGFELWPRVVQPNARARWITAWLEPPAPFAFSEIDVATVRVNGVAVADGTGAMVGDADRDGIPDLQLRFDRAAIERTLAPGDEVTVTVTGQVGGRRFTGTDAIRVLRYPGGSRSDVPRSAPHERVISIHAPDVHGVSSGLRVDFTLVDESPARLEVLDVAGRVLVSREVGARGPGEYTFSLATGEGFTQGVYFLRLRQGVSEARTRMVVIR